MRAKDEGKNCSVVQPTKLLPPRVVFGCSMASLEQDWTPQRTPDEFPPIGSGLEECSGGTDDTKTDIVVPIVWGVVVAIGRPTIPRIVVPRPATLIACPSAQHTRVCDRPAETANTQTPIAAIHGCCHGTDGLPNCGAAG